MKLKKGLVARRDLSHEKPRMGHFVSRTIGVRPCDSAIFAALPLYLRKSSAFPAHFPTILEAPPPPKGLQDGVHPGKYGIGTGYCYVSWGGKEFVYSDGFDILFP